MKIFIISQDCSPIAAYSSLTEATAYCDAWGNRAHGFGKVLKDGKVWMAWQKETDDGDHDFIYLEETPYKTNS